MKLLLTHFAAVFIIGSHQHQQFSILNRKDIGFFPELCEKGGTPPVSYTHLYVPGLGGVRIEDDVLIENGRGVPLNATTKELIILEGNGYEV